MYSKDTSLVVTFHSTLSFYERPISPPLAPKPSIEPLFESDGPITVCAAL